MRTIHADTGILTVMVGIVLFAMLFIYLPLRPQMWVYPLVRQATASKVNYETRDMQVSETEHFIIKYTQADAKVVDMIAQAAEAAYGPVTSQLGYVPHDKTLILVHPDKSHLRKAFGWSGSENAMGVYWGGVIQLLSPQAWLHEGDSVQDFMHSGPMVHEYTHLVFDYMTNGNYSRWFTEGLAQYVEYKVNGYEWHTANNSLRGNLYTMSQLDNDFDNLPNQSLAYRESLAAVRYIAEVHGQDSLRQVIGSLKNGQKLPTAIEKAVGMDYDTYTQAWQMWAAENMK